MSDLISRSELIKVLKDRATNEAIMGYMTAYDVTNSIIDEVGEQPTAYDIGKIVEELEKLADENYKAYCIAFNSDDRAEYDAYTNAIEIVKQEAEKFSTDINVVSNGWIPCSERLPEESGYYLVTYHDWSDGNFLPKYDDTYVRRLHYQISEHFVGWNYPKNVDDRAENDCHKEVIAWQPLPEPFKERD